MSKCFLVCLGFTGVCDGGLDRNPWVLWCSHGKKVHLTCFLFQLVFPRLSFPFVLDASFTVPSSIPASWETETCLPPLTPLLVQRACFTWGLWVVGCTDLQKSYIRMRERILELVNSITESSLHIFELAAGNQWCSFRGLEMISVLSSFHSVTPARVMKNTRIFTVSENQFLFWLIKYEI